MTRNVTAALVLAGVGVLGAAWIATSVDNGPDARPTAEETSENSSQERGAAAGFGRGQASGGQGNGGPGVRDSRTGGNGQGSGQGTGQGPGRGSGHGAGQGTHAAGIPAAVPGAQISTEVEAQLVFMVEEEKLARDVYALAMDEHPDARVFSNINRAESTHMAEIQVLLERYGVVDPTVGKAPGVFADDTLRTLYDVLSSEVGTGRDEAVQAGVTVEVTDIDDLEEALTLAAPADVTAVLENLLAGSQRHLAAFERNGGTVTTT